MVTNIYKNEEEKEYEEFEEFMNDDKEKQKFYHY